MSQVIYRIEESVIFSPEDTGLYRHNQTDNVVAISSAAARLFTLLLKNRGNIVERDTILEKVWDEYGLQASNNNLNQCLSTLRRIIKNMGIDKNIIETIPKVGLRISHAIQIEEINLQPPTLPASDKVPTSPRRARKKIKKKLFYSALLVGLLLMLSLFFNVFHLYNNFQDAQTSLSSLHSPLCAVPSAEMPLLSTLSFNKPH
ncbi:TPA: winged helix-turn-helix domain-containing protein [Serratia rubidaea]|nr:winged helix-turn-helix domain-containing protein [Serratia rubidaea]HDJ1447350.1 winged helix-turn-helix domain-containing protein [Serratia rubidaea]HDJ1460579.1 winged helix-turn-helix domain-containing protein [Serratia rubidaea]HDJ2774436.1 winged helix-turn-helix domain-containing protein [Serratia rubidaea]